MKNEIKIYEKISRMIFKRIINRLIKLGKLSESGTYEGNCYSYTNRFDYFECYPSLMEFHYNPASEDAEVYRIRNGLIKKEVRNKTNVASILDLAEIYDLLIKCK